jgi:DNA adenine methylase
MKTPLTYYGGKQSMLKYIHPLVPHHTVYDEPFMGGGALYWSKKEVRCEMINDINNNIITFYEVLKGGRTNTFDRLVKTSLLSRTQYLKARHIFWGKIKSNKSEKAWAVWYLGNLSFNGDFDGSIKFSKTDNRSYNFIKSSRDNILNPKVIKRLEKTQIDCRDALSVINMIDSTKTFHYIDSPYIGADQGHYEGYTEKDFIKLLNVSSSLKGKFLISCYPGKIIDEYIQQNGWNCKKILLTKSFNNSYGQRSLKIEYLVYNYDETNKQKEIIYD